MKPKYLFPMAALLAAIFYYLTCFRTFTWWDSSEYSLAALTLGIPHPPGSLLTVLLGWLVTLIPLGINKFFELNLLAALMAAITVYLIGRIAFDLHNDKEGESTNILAIVAIAIAALFFGLTHTIWYYAVRFTPYITTALLTTLILLATLVWARKTETPNSHLYFGLILLLFGLDFSIHRTNLLMLPCILLWLALFKPLGFITPKYYIFGIGGLTLGLTMQIINIPLASAQPFLNANNPDNFSRFWDYITLKQYGGGWLINMFPRKAPFWTIQVRDYGSDFAANYFNSAMRPIGFLPLILGLFGLYALYRKSWRIAVGLTGMLIFSSLGAILYFNLPENFFRSIDRHYMPSFVIFGLLTVYGAGAIMKIAMKPDSTKRYSSIIIRLALIILLPICAVYRNFGLVDGSESTFAYDTAHNFLDNLPPHTILYTQSDIDTYTLWCIQKAENCRTDVTVCNMSLMNTPWFFQQVLANDKEYPYHPENSAIDSFSVIPWQDSILALPYSSGSDIPDTIRLALPPSIAGKYLLVSDQVLYKTILANNWKRPLCFSTMLPDQSLQWLKPYLRLDGLYHQLIPEASERNTYSALDSNLTQKYGYNGYYNSRVSKEEPAYWVGWNYCSSFVILAGSKKESGDTTGCAGTISRLKSVIDPEAIGTPLQLLDAIDNACK
jgi:hypothetical protein